MIERRFHPALLALLLLGLGAPPLAAQWEYGSPEAAVASALQADSVHDWQRLIPLLIPDELTRWRDQVGKAMEMDIPVGFLDSCATRAMATYYQLELDSVYRVPTRDSLLRIRPDTLYARAQRWAQRSALTSHPPSRLLDRLPKERIIGSVLANDSLGWVAILSHFDDPPTPDWPANRVSTIEVHRSDGRWLVALDGHLADPGDDASIVMLSDVDCPSRR